MLLWYIDWWWDGMHADTLRFVRNCPVCLIVSGGGKFQGHPYILSQFNVLTGVDIMDLPKFPMYT